MKLAVIGTGYVGLVTGACFANLGNNVVCIDKDPARVKSLDQGQVPFYEPGLPEMVTRNINAGRLTFSQKINESDIGKAEVIFIAVGTPSGENGQADISAVIEVARDISRILKRPRKFKVIVNKSTVPVGMGDIVTKIFIENKVPESRFAVVSNPEFLREGSALFDFMNPDRVVIGAANNRAFNVITELYRPLNAHIIFTSVKSAELIKYASNAFLATKISFINEIANICERVGSDITEVANAVGLDQRIGRQFLDAGLGYGGSCLPKDVSALIHLSRESGYDPRILTAVGGVNEYQVDAFIGKVLKALKNPQGKTVAVLGLSFKPETDDMRAAPSLKVIQSLQKKGANIRAFDPVSSKNARALLPKVDFFSDIYSTLEKADALLVLTEWPEFRELDLKKVKKAMKKPIIIDGRNIYDKNRMKEVGIIYHGVGR